MPSPEMVRAIEYLFDPDHFSAERDFDHSAAIARVNEALRRDELEVVRDPKRGTVKLTASAQDYVSTAVKHEQAQRKITFVPSVFSIPDSDTDSNLVAVMMPFAAEFDGVYESIRKACTSADYHCYRADDIWVNSTFLQDIFDLIFLSAIVVVDFTGKNANVMYETGIAHTLGKIVVPITQNIDDIPSDLKPHRALTYLRNSEGLTELSQQLAQRLATLRKKAHT